MSRARRASRSDAAGGISLFPFLAVLICVMGSLIVLLIALTRQARVQALRAARDTVAKTDAGLEEIENQRELLQWQADQIKESRAKTEAQLAEARLQLGSAEDHIRALRDELARLKAAWDELDRMAAGGSLQRTQAEADLARLKTEIAAAEKRLAEELQAAAHRRNSYAIIPYEGPHGTHRRPVYIECRKDAVVLQPEGIRLTPEDFEGPLGEGNPLAVAVRACREYWAARQGAPRSEDDEDDEPYPLLLVRPDGIAAYYGARDALKAWASEFGYELIGQDWNLKFPPSDPELAKVVAREVAAARARQELLAEIAPRYAGSRSKPTYRAGTRGIVREGESGGDSDTPIRPRVLTFGPRGGDWDEPGAGDVPGTAGAGDQVGADGGIASSAAGALPGSAERLGGGDAAHFFSPPNGAGPASGPVPGDPMAGRTAHPSLGSSDRAFGSQFEVGGQPAGSSASAGGASQPIQERPGETSYGEAAQPAAAKLPDGYVAGRTTPAPDGATAPSTPLRPGEWHEKPPKPAEKPKLDAAASVQDDAGKRARNNLAQMRGRNWGLPGATAGSVPITRPIRVDCYADRLVIAPEEGRGKEVRLGPRTRDSMDEFVAGVWDHMDSWGIAGRGMYWRPVLSVRVAPGAEQRFEETQSLLEGSGLKIERKQ